MAGLIFRKPRVSLEEKLAKGYQPSWAVDQVMDGREKMGGREKRLPLPEQWRPRRHSHCRRRRARRCRGNRAYGHQTDHRDHWDDVGMMASSPRDNTRPRSGPRGVRAMADGEELTGTREFTPRDHQTRKGGMGR
jgi:hypothetical protein